ncbi:MAG: hypothetical protein JST83_02075 [Bacteroidetes bacterium]|nr:hypothetical protein [Bacteroidota bacterium]
MSSKVSVRLGLRFQKEAKRLIKKYPSLLSELSDLNSRLKEKPTSGTPLGNNLYKIRIAIKSKGKGKSGGARVISHVETEIIGILENSVVSLLTIYDKSETSSISKDDINGLLKDLLDP